MNEWRRIMNLPRNQGTGQLESLQKDAIVITESKNILNLIYFLCALIANKDLKQTWTTTTTRISPNKRFEKQHNCKLLILMILVVLCKKKVWNDQVLGNLKQTWATTANFLYFLLIAGVTELVWADFKTDRRAEQSQTITKFKGKTQILSLLGVVVIV